MKKNLLSTLFAVFALASMAQNVPVDYEPGGNGADWTWTVFENTTNPPLEIIANPDMSASNPSSTVAKFTATADGAPFAGCETMHGSDIGTFTLNPSTSTITIQVWKSVISNVGIKLVEAGNGSLGELLVPNTLVDEWETISFDFSSMEGIEYDQIVVFPDFADRAQENIIYFDNITFGETIPLAEPMGPAPDPTEDEELVLSMFSNTYPSVLVDTWLTAWSQGVLQDIQIDGNDTKKYSGLNFVGVETLGGNLIDASEMDFFHMDVWSANFTELRIKLVDFGADEAFEGGDDSEHEVIYDMPAQEEWISYQIPMEDFVDLMNTDNIAQLVISAGVPGQAVVYVDNVYFSKTASNINENLEDQINVFPNPATEVINITGAELSSTYQILDAFGRLIEEGTITSEQTKINTSALSTGAYRIVFNMNGSKAVKQFLKK